MVYDYQISNNSHAIGIQLMMYIRFLVNTCCFEKMFTHAHHHFSLIYLNYNVFLVEILIWRASIGVQYYFISVTYICGCITTSPFNPGKTEE